MGGETSEQLSVIHTLVQITKIQELSPLCLFETCRESFPWKKLLSVNNLYRDYVYSIEPVHSKFNRIYLLELQETGNNNIIMYSVFFYCKEVFFS